MSAPLYVPVLPTRRHAARAYRRLGPDIRDRLRPLWNLPHRPGLSSAQLRTALAGDVEEAARGLRWSAWLDAPLADEAEANALTEVLPPDDWGVWNLNPVTGPDRPAAQQSLALDAARHAGRQLALRVCLYQEWSDDRTAPVRDLLDRADPGVATHLVLDLGTVLAARTDAAKEALRALDALCPLAPWRTVTVASGASPPPTADLPEGVPHPAPRADWALWQEINRHGRAYVPLLRHGDYGALPAAHVARPPRPNQRGGPPWGVLRYTSADHVLLTRVRQRGPDRERVIRTAARRLTQLPEFRGASASAGEAWLRACAAGTGGSGNAETWNTHGNVQHLTYVVRCLTAPTPP